MLVDKTHKTLAFRSQSWTDSVGGIIHVRLSEHGNTVAPDTFCTSRTRGTSPVLKTSARMAIPNAVTRPMGHTVKMEERLTKCQMNVNSFCPVKYVVNCIKVRCSINVYRNLFWRYLLVKSANSAGEQVVVALYTNIKQRCTCI